ncbi:family 10 glycosylhydrolase [Paenibacillus yanchengensis]|uniref:Family 10 glycosylhydrolase n=1 Tax=Paenibacillus yanchengensis TaxID=2035833 RepID=A0ABW4YHK5_9BACL
MRKTIKVSVGILSLVSMLLMLTFKPGDYPLIANASTTASVAGLTEKVVEEFEGTGFISSIDPIQASTTLQYAKSPAPVVFGNSSAQLTYQFSPYQTGSSAAYLNFWNDATQKSYLQLEGKPTKLGIWVYGDGNNKHWLRAEFNNGKIVDLTSNSGFNWTGWKQIIFDVPSTIKEPIQLRRIYTVQTKQAAKTDGTIYFDQLTAYYSKDKDIVAKPDKTFDFNPPKQEFRAAWIATVERIDWPKTNDPTEQQQQFIDLLDFHQSLGMNAIVMQIKPTADAFYPSAYAPWSHWLTGVQGKHPGYDPLAFMIEETHKRNMEFHAWFNPYRVSTNNKTMELSADHIARKQPDWVMEYKGKLYFDPGQPEVVDYISKSVMEVVKNYDIDGVHFDDYFYPNRFDGMNYPDQATFEKFGKKAYGQNINAWRRDNVDTLIERLSKEIKATKKFVKFGISPFGVWRNKADDPKGSNTTAGQPSYDNLHADIRKWVANDWIDYVAPQIYWNFGFKPAPYEELVKWWSDTIRTTKSKTQLYIGHAAYKVDENENFTDPNEIIKQMIYNLKFKEVQGSIQFTTRDLLAKPHLRKQVQDRYQYGALIPPLSAFSKDNKLPVSTLTAETLYEGVQLSWKDQDASSAYYVIYRSTGKQKLNQQDATQLIATVRKPAGSSQLSYVDRTAVAGQTYQYAVTAVNRMHVESKWDKASTVQIEAGKYKQQTVSTYIEAGQGGIVNLDSKALVVVAVGTAKQAFRLQLEQLFNYTYAELPKLTLLSGVYEISKDSSTRLAKPLQLRISFEPSKLLASEEAALYRYNNSKKQYERVEGAKRENDSFMVADVNELTKYAVFAVEKTGGTVSPKPTPSPTPTTPEVPGTKPQPNQCEAANFTDIGKHWAKAQIEQAVARCMVSGYDDGTFQPNKAITREEFAVMLVRALQIDAANAALPFKDSVTIGKWSLDAVERAIGAGIISGYNDGYFRPKALVNRAEVTAMAVRALQLTVDTGATTVSTSFLDNHLIPAWVKPYAKTAADHKLIAGRSGNYFAADASTTRAEAVVIILRLTR